MKTKLEGAFKSTLTLLAAPLLALVWLAKRLAFAIFFLGLLIPLLPKPTVEQFLHLPFVARVSPVFTWLIEHGLRVCLVLSFLLILRLLRKIDRLQNYQAKQATILGGLLSYLEITDYRFSYAIEEAKQSGFSFVRFLNQKARNFFAKLVGGEGAGEFIAGTDPFDTAFKRGNQIVTLRDDMKKYAREMEGQRR